MKFGNEIAKIDSQTIERIRGWWSAPSHWVVQKYLSLIGSTWVRFKKSKSDNLPASSTCAYLMKFATLSVITKNIRKTTHNTVAFSQQKSYKGGNFQIAFCSFWIRIVNVLLWNTYTESKNFWLIRTWTIRTKQFARIPFFSVILYYIGEVSEDNQREYAAQKSTLSTAQKTTAARSGMRRGLA